jgi:hypothetical protein
VVVVVTAAVDELDGFGLGVGVGDPLVVGAVVFDPDLATLEVEDDGATTIAVEVGGTEVEDAASLAGGAAELCAGTVNPGMPFPGVPSTTLMLFQLPEVSP